MMKILFSRKSFVAFNTIFLCLIAVVMVLPFVKIVAESLSSGIAVDKGEVLFWPIGFTLDNYRAILSDPTIVLAFKNSVLVTVFGTLFNLFMTALLAYPISRPQFMFSKPVLIMATITIIFPVPLIPNYLLIKQLGLLDTLFALVVPFSINTFNFFVLLSFFRSIPEELIESARMDGCNEFRILAQIVTPLSKASLATLGLFYGVANWNNFFHPMMFIKDTKLITLPVKLNRILESSEIQSDFGSSDAIIMSPEAMKMTTIIIATVPILFVYPFLQKHFAKGATLGSIKG